MRFVPAALLFLLPGLLSAQQPTPLRNGQQVVLHGTLSMAPAGRLQFVTVSTATAYMPQGADAAKPIRQVGLSGYNRYDLLYRHRGQAVTVTGTIMIDGASPYYFHSTSLKAASIRLANGTELIGTSRVKSRLAVDVGQYRARVLLGADLAAPWEYSAQGSPDTEHRFLSCGSNGGGDVVNCDCAEGFHAVSGEALAGNARTRGRIFSDSGTAQFDVGDDARKSELTVTCSR